MIEEDESQGIEKRERNMEGRGRKVKKEEEEEENKGRQNSSLANVKILLSEKKHQGNK